MLGQKPADPHDRLEVFVAGEAVGKDCDRGGITLGRLVDDARQRKPAAAIEPDALTDSARSDHETIGCLTEVLNAGFKCRF
jgi:hypothetical protein